MESRDSNIARHPLRRPRPRAHRGWPSCPDEAMVNATASSAIAGILFTNTIMVALVIVLAHKSHEIIYETADNVMKWIGFGVTPMGSVKSEGEVKGMAKGGSATTERMTGAALGKLGGVRARRAGKAGGSVGGDGKRCLALCRETGGR